jgi:hypothetical protein
MQMQKRGYKRGDSPKGAKEQPRSYSFHLFHETKHNKEMAKKFEKYQA